MTWAIAGLICLGISLVLFESMRGKSNAGVWMLIIAISAPVFLGLFVWRDLSHDCSTLRPPALDPAFQGDFQNKPLAQQREQFETMRVRVSERLENCGGTQARWGLFQNLSQIIEQLDQALIIEQTQEITDT